MNKLRKLIFFFAFLFDVLSFNYASRRKKDSEKGKKKKQERFLFTPGTSLIKS